MDDDRFDCRTCGACCGPLDDAPAYVALSARDAARLPAPYATDAVVRDDDGSALATTRCGGATVCVALRGTVGEAVTCAIYDDRPRGCRLFRPGSRICRIVRTLRLGVDDDA